MKLPIKILNSPFDRGGVSRITLRPNLLHALGLRRGEPVLALVTPGAVVVCRAEWGDVFESILRDFPAAFVSEPEAAPEEAGALDLGDLGGE